MAIQQITHYDIQTKVKKGWTIEDFCTRYQCTEAEFERRVRQLFRDVPEADGFMRRMQENVGKKNRQHRSGSVGNKGKRSPMVNPSSLPAGAQFDESALALFQQAGGSVNSSPDQTGDEDISRTDSAGITPKADTSPEAAEETPATQLARFKEREAELSQIVMDLESQHKVQTRLHRGCIKQLREINGQLEQIQRDFRAKATEYERVVKQDNDYIATMNQISARRAEEVAKLSEVREHIRALTVVTVFAYADGKVEPLDETDFPINDNGSEELFATLRTEAHYDDLRGKDIRALARLLAIVHNAGSIRIEPVFENEEIEPYFRELIAQDSPSTSPQ